MNKNENSTRFYSDKQEKAVCKVINGYQSSNSGAGRFRKGDVYNKSASVLVECKTVMSAKSSVSIKKDWISKNKEEAFSQGLFNSCVAVNFEPDSQNYFLIDEKLMRFLIEKLEEANK